MIRSHVCNRNPDTVVACHVRIIGISGMGVKAPDLLAAWGCSDCHALCDRRTPSELSKAELDLLLLMGVMRTQAELIRMGLLKW